MCISSFGVDGKNVLNILNDEISLKFFLNPTDFFTFRVYCTHLCVFCVGGLEDFVPLIVSEVRLVVIPLLQFCEVEAIRFFVCIYAVSPAG